MIKRFTSIILVAVLCITIFCGCRETESITSNESVVQTEKYSDEQVLFAAQDRCDIEDDRHTVYSYNYKGELLDSLVSSGNVGYFSQNGLAPALDPQTYKFGFVDKDGVFKIEPKYNDAAPFSKDGIALVKIEVEENGEIVEKCGYINSKGEEVTQCIYDKATSFFDCGYALATIYRPAVDEAGDTYREYWKECIINTTGEVVVEIDTLAENRTIRTVYKDYFICATDSGLTIHDYSDNKLDEINQNESYYLGKNFLQKWDDEKTEKFDGKKFVELKQDDTGIEMYSKNVATTQSGIGYGVTKNAETVIPFEYDNMYFVGSYVVAIKYTGANTNYEQTFDIYDADFNKTAENVNFAFSLRFELYGDNCQLPNGYFQIMQENEDYGTVYGIIDYTGKIIVEPVFGRGIRLYTYEGAGIFDLH